MRNLLRVADVDQRVSYSEFAILDDQVVLCIETLLRSQRVQAWLQLPHLVHKQMGVEVQRLVSLDFWLLLGTDWGDSKARNQSKGNERLHSIYGAG